MKVYLLETCQSYETDFMPVGIYASRELAEKAFIEKSREEESEDGDFYFKNISEFDLDVYELLRTKFSLSDEDYRAMIMNTRLEFDGSDAEDGSISLYNLLKDGK